MTAKIQYYLGWTVRNTFRTTIRPVWRSAKTAETFRKFLGRPASEPELLIPTERRGLCMKDGDVWRMWYTSFIDGKSTANHPEPLYNIKYANLPTELTGSAPHCFRRFHDRNKKRRHCSSRLSLRKRRLQKCVHVPRRVGLPDEQGEQLPHQRRIPRRQVFNRVREWTSRCPTKDGIPL